jgi:HKD family nuclease
MATRGSNIDLIENRGPNTLLATLRKLLATHNCSVVEFQVAFASAAGVGELLPSLRRAASRTQVRIVTGLYQGVTEPSALRLLFKVAQQTKGRLQTRLAKDVYFHRKLYVIGTPRVRYIISGSSNLTREGLASRGEFNLLAGLEPTDAGSRHLHAQFETLWSRGTVPVSLARIKKYAAARKLQAPRPVPKDALLAILGRDGSEADEGEVSVVSAPRYWRDHVSGFADPKTEAVVGDETDWDRRGYDWYSSQTDSFHAGDRILLLDARHRSAELAVVKDTTSMRRSTPDGRHFVAFVPAHGRRRRRLGKNFGKSLAAIGLPLSVATRTKRRKLSAGQWARI